MQDRRIQRKGQTESWALPQGELRWRWYELAFVAAFFLFACIWAMKTPYSLEINGAPDEWMRFLVPQYIYEHGTLPTGYDLIEGSIWGFSYAFYPCFLGPLLSALFMKLVSFFTTDSLALVLAARGVSVLAGTVTVYFAMKLSKRMFPRPFHWLLPVLVASIPQFQYLCAYVNNDILCVCGVSIILYGWVSGLLDGWKIRNCLLLASGIVIVALTYYNGYSWILCSVFLFAGSFLLQRKKKGDMGQMWKYGLLIAAVVLLLAAPFFIRNAMLYNGDFLGMHTLTASSEQYAIDELKPSLRNTPKNAGESLWHMLQSTERTSLSWWKFSYISFIGRFGFMACGVTDAVLRLWSIVLAVGVLAWAAGCLASVLRIRKQRAHGKASAETQLIHQKKRLLCGCMLLASCIVVALSIYYSYAVDYQPQGRYLYTIVIALMYIVSGGWTFLFSRVRSKIGQHALVAALCIVLTAVSIVTFTGTYLPFVAQ